MKVHISHLEKDDCIHVVAEGNFPQETSRIFAIYEEMADLSKKYHTNKFVIDYRKMNYDLPITNMMSSVDRIKRHSFAQKK